MSSQRRDYDDDLPRYSSAARRGKDPESEDYDPDLEQSLRRLWWAAGIAWLVAICVLYLTYCHKPPREANTQVQAPKPAAVAQSTTGQSGTAGGQSTADGPMSNGYRVGPDGKLLQPDQGNPTPPKLPEEAKQKTPEGAQAYAEHYIALLTYAFKTGQTQELKDSYSAKCESCASRTASIESLYSGGGWTDGDGYIVENPRAATQVNDEDKTHHRWHVRLTIKTPPYTLVENNAVEQVEGDTTETSIAVCWQNDAWIVCGTSSKRTS